MSGSTALPISIGLHITKCAGTSLATTVRRNMTEDEYYICSSYFENLLAARPLFSDIVCPDRLKFIFGHFVHESLISIFRDRSIYLFTGLREPIARAMSHLLQINTTNRRAGAPLMTADQYLTEAGNGQCDEIIRAFPFASDVMTDVTKFGRARGILSMFDYIYDSDTFDKHAPHVFQSIPTDEIRIYSDNISSEKILDAELSEFSRVQADMIRSAGVDVLKDDLELYEAFLPHLGRGRLNKALSNESWAIDREAFADSLATVADEAKTMYDEYETGHLVHEFRVLGRLDQLREMMASRQARSIDILQRI